MTVLKALNDNVDAVIAYLKAGPPTPTLTTTTTTGGDPKEPEGWHWPLFYLILGVIIILCHYAWCAAQCSHLDTKTPSNRSEGKPENPETTFWQDVKHWMGGNKCRLVGVFAIILLLAEWKVVGMPVSVLACITTGAPRKGYKPEQPIKFSHKAPRRR